MPQPVYLDRAIIAQGEKLLRALDKDHSGYISESEWRARPKLPPLALQSLSSLVSQYEFDGQWGAPIPVQQLLKRYQGQTSYVMAREDVNEDGVVTHQEHRYWNADINRDGKISKGEVAYADRPLECRVPYLNREREGSGTCEALRRGAGIR